MKKPRRPKPVFDLPSPAEVNSAAAELSDAPQSAQKAAPKAKKAAQKAAPRRSTPAPPKKRESPAEAPKIRETAIETAPRNPIGRPRANHGRKSTSVMVQPEIWKRLKLLALHKDVDLSEMLEDLFLDYLKKEERKL